MDVVATSGGNEHLRWFYSPNEHIFQIALCNIVLVPFSIVVWRRFWTQEARKDPKDLAPLAAPRPLYVFETASVVLLAVAWVLAFFHKCQYGARRITSMLYPCHPYTLLVLLAFYYRSRNYRTASYIWNYTIQTCILSGIAMALPDTSDIIPEFRWWAIPTFWTHHTLLTIVPYIALFTRAFHVTPNNFNSFWFPFAYATGTLYFFDVQQTVSLFLNTFGRHWGTDTEAVCNINYMIHPPPVAGTICYSLFH